MSSASRRTTTPRSGSTSPRRETRPRARPIRRRLPPPRLRIRPRGRRRRSRWWSRPASPSTSSWAWASWWPRSPSSSSWSSPVGDDVRGPEAKDYSPSPTFRRRVGCPRTAPPRGGRGTRVSGEHRTRVPRAVHVGRPPDRHGEDRHRIDGHRRGPAPQRRQGPPPRPDDAAGLATCRLAPEPPRRRSHRPLHRRSDVPRGARTPLAGEQEHRVDAAGDPERSPLGADLPRRRQPDRLRRGPAGGGRRGVGGRRGRIQGGRAPAGPRDDRVPGSVGGEDPRGLREPRDRRGRDPDGVRPRRRAVPPRPRRGTHPRGSAGRGEGNPRPPADGPRRASRAAQEGWLPRRKAEGQPQGPPRGRGRGPPEARLGSPRRPSLRRDDGPGHRDEGEPRDGARRDARPRLAALLLRQDGRGRADESGRPVPEAREGPGGDPARPRVRRGTPENRQDPMGRPRAVHAETRFQGDRLHTLPRDRGPRDAGARAPPGDPSGPLRRASLPRERYRVVAEGAGRDPPEVPGRRGERHRRDLDRGGGPRHPAGRSRRLLRTGPLGDPHDPAAGSDRAQRGRSRRDAGDEGHAGRSLLLQRPPEGTEDAPGARPPAEATEAEELRGAAGRGDVRRGGSGEANRVLAGRDSRGAPADGPPAAGRQERSDEVRGFLRRRLVLYLGRPYEARAP